jgi:ankyrin repeat protein
MLLGAGADVKAKDEKGKTSLHYVVEASNIGLVRILLKAKADVNATDNSGATALHYAFLAVPAKVRPILIELLDAGANPDIQDDQGESVWHKVLKYVALNHTNETEEFLALLKQAHDRIKPPERELTFEERMARIEALSALEE